MFARSRRLFISLPLVFRVSLVETGVSNKKDGAMIVRDKEKLERAREESEDAKFLFIAAETV